MTTVAIEYGTSTVMTCTLTSLASSSTLLAGRESTAVDNTSTLAVDYLVSGKVTSGSTTPIVGVIEVWAYGSEDGTRYSGGATGSDANLTFAAEKPLLPLLQSIPVDTTASHTYEWGPCSIKTFFGQQPRKWGLFFVHNTSAALHGTASNFEQTRTSIKYTNA